MMVGYSANGGGTGTPENRPSGTMYLAKNNTITLNNTGTAISVGSKWLPATTVIPDIFTLVRPT